MHFKFIVAILCLFLSIFVVNQSAYIGNEDEPRDMREHNEVNKRNDVMEMELMLPEDDYVGLGFNNNDRDKVNVKKRSYPMVLTTASFWNNYLRPMRPEPETKNTPDDYLRYLQYYPILRPENVAKRYYLRAMRKRDYKDYLRLMRKRASKDYLRVMKKRYSKGNNFVNHVSIQ